MAHLSPEYMLRFGGIGRLYGARALPSLARAHVAVVGVGGVGSWAVEALARSGIGQLSLIDLDDICIQNTNRQLHTLSSTVGQQKVDALAARARAINPELQVHAVSDFFTPQTLELIHPGLDYVVDAIDHAQNKALLLASCVRQNIPVVTCGAAGGRRDPTRIEVADLNRTGSDGLLRHVRRMLRQDHGFEAKGDWGIPCVFTREAAVYPTKDGGTAQTRDRSISLKLDCASGFGTASFVTGAFGFHTAALVVGALAEKLAPQLPEGG